MAFLVLSLSLSAQEEPQGYSDLSATEFYIQMEQHWDAVVLDVRLFSEYRKERIPGALLAEKKSRLIDLTDTLDKETPMFVYCEDAQRSRTVCGILTGELEFQHVYNLEGGLIEWKRHGLPVDTERIKRFQIRNLFE